MSYQSAIDAAGGGKRLSQSTLSDGVVDQSPEELLAQARRLDADVTLEEYTLARVMYSENGSGPAVHLLCIGDADVNRAERKRVSVFKHATGGTSRFGQQGVGGRPVSTRFDPTVRTLRAARFILSGDARGITRGGTHYYDPRTQLAMWAKGDPHYCHPLAILESWTFSRPIVRRTTDDEGRRVCELGDSNGGGMEWVGAIDGVDAWDLMVLKTRSTAASQARHYEEARAVIESRGATQPTDNTELVALVAAAGVAAAAARVL